MDYNTPFKRGIEDKMREKKLSESSIKLYLRNLEKLNDDLPLKNTAFLKDPEAILAKLSNYKENTKRGYLISICATLNLDKSTKPKQKLYDQYFKLMVDKNKELKEQEGKHELSETQKENWIDWKEVETKFTELKEKVDKFGTAKELNEHNYNTLLSYVILALYYYKQPRRNLDYQKMTVIKADDPALPTDTNYLAYDAKQFVFNTYKTSKKSGQQKEDIPEPLMAIINLYLKFHPLIKGKKPTKTSAVPFLVYYSGKPLDKVNSITRILNKVFGKSVGSSMLRHIWLTHKYGNTIQEQQKDAEAMGHSVAQQQDYVKTIPAAANPPGV